MAETDLISRQAVNAIIDALFQNQNHTIIASPNVWHAFREIQKLPSVNNWIQCSERLPKDVGHYLVTIESRSSYSKKRFISIAIKDSRGWMSDENIIAWQPLPEPYKENEE